jgi:hypothetical protein
LTASSARPDAGQTRGRDAGQLAGGTGEALELAMRSGLPFTGLRDFDCDPKLFHYVPLPMAVAQRVVPVVIVGDTLKVASAGPNPDISLLRRRFPALTVDIVIAPGREIDAVLQRAQGAT